MYAFNLIKALSSNHARSEVAERREYPIFIKGNRKCPPQITELHHLAARDVERCDERSRCWMIWLRILP